MVGLVRMPLVGRTVLLADLQAVLEESATGQGGAAVLYGEAGIGKTRLLEESAQSAQHLGFTVAWGRCTDLEGVQPFWPWRHVLEALGLPPSVMDQARSRERLLGLLLEAVGEAARPVLLCLEDLHWADVDIRWLLRGAVDATAGRALAVLCTWRTAEGAVELADLPPRVHRVALSGLDLADARQLARSVAGEGLTEQESSQAADQAGGNPLFVRELVRMRLAGGGADRVPGGVRDVLTRRMARLPTGTVAALSAAAVLGSKSAVEMVARSVDAPLATVLERLDVAATAGLIEDLDGGRVVFVHAVIREVLLEQAGLLGRAALHEQAARALERLPVPPAESLALHWSKVPGQGAAERAVLHGRLARDRARSVHALGQAVAFAELVWTRSGDPEDLVVLGDARARSGDLTGARVDLLAAAEAGRDRDRPELLARAALALAAGEGGFEIALADVEQVALLEEAAGRLPVGGLRARVRARLAVATSPGSPLEERTALARSAIAEAEEHGDEGALLHALAAYADMVGAPRHLAERRAVADRMLDLATRLGDLDGELLARRFRLVALLESGELTAADAEIAAFERVARSTQEPAHLWYPPLWHGMRALLADRVADAEAHADEVEQVGGLANSANAAMLAATLRIACRWGQPELGELKRSMDDYADGLAERSSPQVLVARSCLAAGMRDPVETARHYRPLATAGFGSLPEDAEHLSGLLGLSEAALLLADRRGAADLHALLSPYPHLWIVDGIGAVCWGVVAEWLGRLEELLDKPADAARHRADALATYRAANALGPLRRLTGTDTDEEGFHGELVRQDGGWLVRWSGTQTVLPDLKGLRDLAALVVRPGESVPAVTLLAGTTVLGAAVVGGSDAVLDEKAKGAYRNRLRELEDEIAEAEADGDLGTTQRRRDEREFLIRELAAALGLGGRSRRLGDETDRARKAVTMRLRDVISRLDRSLPELAGHLRAAVRTGRDCCYAPPHPVRWRVRD